MVKVVCHSCGAVYDHLKLEPGTRFSCGGCGTVLVVPDIARELPPLEPLEDAAASQAPRAPVVKPGKRSGPVKPPTPRKEAPAGGSRGPVVKPKARGPQGKAPVVKPRPPAAKDGAPAPRPKAPAAPGRKPVVKPRAPAAAGQGPIVKPKASPPPAASPAAAPGTRAAPKRRAPAAPGAKPRAAAGAAGKATGPRRTRGRPRTRVVPVAEPAEGPPSRKKKGPAPIVWAGAFLGVAAIVLVAVLITSGGLTDEQRADAYAAGYVASCKAMIRESFGGRVKHPEDLYKTWSAKVETPSEEDFIAGARDGRAFKKPRVRADEIHSRIFDADFYLRLFDRKHPATTADDAWAAAGKLEEEARVWERRGAPTSFLKALKERRQTLLDKVLRLDPDFAAIRTQRGEVKYKNELEPYIDAEYLEQAQRDKARRAHERLLRIASKNGGWVPKKEYERVAKVKDDLAEREARYKAMTASPFFKQSEEVARKIMESVNQTFAKAREWPTEEIRKQLSEEQIASLKKTYLKNIDKRKFTIRRQAPYVVLVEEDPGWDPTHIVESQVLQPLVSLNKTFLDQYQEKYGLDPAKDPIPVVFLRNKRSYQQYLIGQSGGPSEAVLAHFEPNNGRLVLNADTDFTTILHEGTHQLFWHYTRNIDKKDIDSRSYWFQEGMAEWFSGARRTRNPQTGEWEYEIGLLQEQRFRSIAFLLKSKVRDKPGGALTLPTLLKTTYATRRVEPWKTSLVYAQGWMFIYFMNYFRVDDEGVVQIDTKEKPVVGVYRDRWEKYVGAELNGESGFETFKKVFGLDDAALQKMTDEFEKYQHFIMRKIRYRQIKDKRLIPWNEYRNSRGELAGEKTDDMLDPPKKSG